MSISQQVRQWHQLFEMPLHYKRRSRKNPFEFVSHLNGGGMQCGGYIVPFKGSGYQYGGYINPFIGSSYQYGTGIGFYRRQSGAGFLDVVKGIFRFLMPIVAPAAIHAGSTFMGNLSKGVESGKSFKDSAKEALKPTLEAAIEKGTERFIASQNKEAPLTESKDLPSTENKAGAGRKRKRTLVYKGGNKKAKHISSLQPGLKDILKYLKRNHKGGNKGKPRAVEGPDNF